MSNETSTTDIVTMQAPNSQDPADPPMLEDISGFLETLHSKNLTLKKLAKVQQTRIDDLTRENRALKFENELKYVEVKELKAKLQMLEEEVKENEQAIERSTEASNVLKELPSNSAKTTPKKARRSPVAADSGKKAGGSSSLQNGSSPKGVGRVLQMLRKINNIRKVDATSVVFNLYTSCLSAIQVVLTAIYCHSTSIRPRSRPSTGLRVRRRRMRSRTCLFPSDAQHGALASHEAQVELLR